MFRHVARDGREPGTDTCRQQRVECCLATFGERRISITQDDPQIAEFAVGQVQAASANQPAALLRALRDLHLKMINAVLTGGGLAGVAELAAAAAGSPVAIVVPGVATAVAPRRLQLDCPAFQQWVAERLRGRPAALPADLLAEVPIRLRGELVGAVGLLQSERAVVSGATEFLHQAAAATLTELAVRETRAAVERELRGAFLEELRSREDLTGAEVIRRAARLGCDLSRGAVILCAELTSDRPQLALATIAAEYPGVLAQQLDGGGPDGRPRVYAALPSAGDGSGATTVELARRLAARLEHVGVVGLSSFHADPGGLRAAIYEAELMLGLLMRNKSAAVAQEINSSTYKLLFRVLASHPEELRSFHEATMAPLVQHDEQHHADLVATLQAYLDANCNMNAAAGAIGAHRHTVAYRLDRIRELTELDPLVSEDRERLGLGLKIHRLTAPG